MPCSRKVYVEERARTSASRCGRSRSRIRRPPSAPKNPPVYVYGTSGPYTVPNVKIDIRARLTPLRARWIEERGDTEVLARRRASAWNACEARRDALQPEAPAPPAEAGRQRDADALRAPRPRHPRGWSSSRCAGSSAATPSVNCSTRQHPG
ncbi:MAG: hypothetical protein U1E63_13620 [Burkholderiales bacterium]